MALKDHFDSRRWNVLDSLDWLCEKQCEKMKAFVSTHMEQFLPAHVPRFTHAYMHIYNITKSSSDMCAVQNPFSEVACVPLVTLIFCDTHGCVKAVSKLEPNLSQLLYPPCG